jgi:2-hydroxychromene-2-carboxylate isomerase
MKTVRFYFDFISPYSWLALSEASEFADQHGVVWEINVEVSRTVVRECGLAPGDLSERIAARTVKDTLRDWTQEALDLGVLGVPTFVYAGELFWGHGRLPDLGRRVEGISPPSSELVKTLAARPRGIDRRLAP